MFGLPGRGTSASVDITPKEVEARRPVSRAAANPFKLAIDFLAVRRDW